MDKLPDGLKRNKLGFVVSDGSCHPVDGKSRTIKSHAKGLTVNEIMKRFAVTGTIPDRGVPAQFMDASMVPDLFTALNMRKGLNDYFAGLDAQTRADFRNDPVELVKFVSDPRNVDQGIKMGLLKLNEKGQAAKAEWDKAQAKLKADRRTAFKAEISDVLKGVEGAAPPPLLTLIRKNKALFRACFCVAADHAAFLAPRN